MPDLSPTDERLIPFLIVDDDEDNLFLLENLLPGNLCQVVKALSGREALDKIFELRFRAMFIDIMMPGLDGLSTAQIIRNKAEFDDLQIIFVTAVDPKNPLIEQAQQIKNSQVIFKPIHRTSLQACIKKCLATTKTRS